MLHDSRIHAEHLPALYRGAADRFEALPAFATRQSDRSWKPLSFRNLYERGEAIGEGLIDFGVEAREPVGLFSDNRVEWMLADVGIQTAGAVNTPRGVDLTDEDLVYIVNHSEMKVAFVETSRMAERCLKMRERLPGLRTLIQLDSSRPAPNGVITLDELEASGSSVRKSGPRRTEARIAGIHSADTFTLIYTSGTTGTPKGVRLTHANMMSQVECAPVEFPCADRALSILPIWHIFERMIELVTLSHGTCTYYTSARYFADDLKQVEPTFMASAPRLWESLRHRILTRVRNAHPVRRALFHTAYFLAVHYREARTLMRGQELRVQPISNLGGALRRIRGALQWTFLLPWYGFFNAAVLETVRRGAGGSLKGTISGGGALSPEVDRFFNAIGIPMLEGYGLTETSPVVSVRTKEKLVRGTVGPLIPRTELRIVDLESREILYPNPSLPHEGRGCRGEILVRGPQVMPGYFKNEEATTAVLDQEGWFRTGDLGMMTFNGSLKILGRGKATLVLSNGGNGEPEPIEMRLKLSPLIGECIAVGQDAKHVCALILPDLEGCRDAGFAAGSLEELVRDPALAPRIQAEIRSLMGNPSEFKRYEVVQDFRFLERPLEVGMELTNLFKLKRHVIHERYADRIAEMTETRGHHD